MRPKLGSPPCSAVLTSGELATARATGSTASGPAAHDDARRPAARPRRRPRSRARAGAAARRAPRRARSSSGALRLHLHARGAVREREHGVAGGQLAVDGDAVEGALARTRPVSRSSVSARARRRSATKQNIVAKRGEIMPAPLACAASRTRAGRAASPRGRRAWAPRSLVRIAVEKSSASSPSAAQAARTPASTRLARQLDADHAGRRHADLRRPPRRAPPPRRPACASAVSSPRWPSPTFEQPRVGDDRAQAVELGLARHDHRRAHAGVGGEARGRDRVRLVRDEHAHVEPLAA